MTTVKTFCAILVVIIYCSGYCNADYLGRLCHRNWTDHSYYVYGITVDKCIWHCNSSGYAYAGLLQGLLCMCSNAIDSTLPLCIANDTATYPICSQHMCSVDTAIPCEGDVTMACGGKEWYSVYDSSASLMNTISSCSTSIANVCSSNTSSHCSWTCSHVNKCTSTAIYGTGQYSTQSSYCAAAAHDLRYVMGTEQIVMTIPYPDAVAALQGSWRYGIESMWTTQSTHLAVFTSPKTSAVPAGAYLADIDLEGGGAGGFGHCYLKPNSNCTIYTAQNVNSILNSTNQTMLPFSTSDASRIYCSYCNRMTGDCLPASDIPLVLASMNALCYANSLSITLTNGEYADILFNVSKAISTSAITVTKGLHGIPYLRDGTGTVHVEIINVTVQHQGFYHLNINGIPCATTRLIFVESLVGNACGEYGRPSVDGSCVCFHPYSGNNCSAVCPASTFGPDCNYNCTQAQCKGQVICAGDPVGCHCSSGWMGSFCNTSCPVHTFGPDCLMDGCHCATGVCDRFTGLCNSSACLPGYFGPSCSDLGPYLNAPPVIINGTYNGATIQWKLWTRGNDSGTVGPPNAYILQRQADGSADWLNISIVQAVACSDRLCSVQDYGQLLVNHQYQYRIRTVFSGILEPASPVAVYTPHCQPPISGPNITNVTVMDKNEVFIQWRYPPSDQIRCNEMNASLLVQCLMKGACFGRLHKDSVPVNATTTSITVTPPLYSDCNVQVAMSTDLSISPVVSASRRFVTSVGQPEPVGRLVCYQTGRNILVTWAQPLMINGPLVAYYVHIFPAATSNNTVLFEQSQFIPEQGNTFEVAPSETSFQYPVKNISQESQKFGVQVQASNGEYNSSIGGPAYEFVYEAVPIGKNASNPEDQHQWFWVIIILLILLLFICIVTFIWLLCVKRVREGKKVSRSSTPVLVREEMVQHRPTKDTNVQSTPLQLHSCTCKLTLQPSSGWGTSSGYASARDSMSATHLETTAAPASSGQHNVYYM